MDILNILFGWYNHDSRNQIQSRAEEVIRGTDENSRIVYDKHKRSQSAYLGAQREARVILEASDRLIKHLDALSAIAIATNTKAGLK